MAVGIRSGLLGSFAREMKTRPDVRAVKAFAKKMEKTPDVFLDAIGRTQWRGTNKLTQCGRLDKFHGDFSGIFSRSAHDSAQPLPQLYRSARTALLEGPSGDAAVHAYVHGVASLLLTEVNMEISGNAEIRQATRALGAFERRYDRLVPLLRECEDPVPLLRWLRANRPHLAAMQEIADEIEDPESNIGGSFWGFPSVLRSSARSGVKDETVAGLIGNMRRNLNGIDAIESLEIVGHIITETADTGLLGVALDVSSAYTRSMRVKERRDEPAKAFSTIIDAVHRTHQAGDTDGTVLRSLLSAGDTAITFSALQGVHSAIELAESAWVRSPLRGGEWDPSPDDAATESAVKAARKDSSFG